MEHETMNDLMKVQHLHNAVTMLGDEGIALYTAHAPRILTGLATGDQATTHAGLRALRTGLNNVTTPVFTLRIEADFYDALLARANQWDIGTD